MAEENKTGAAAEAGQEKQTNCLSCNKPLKKIRRYYRDGKFYCTKKCWKKFIDSKKEGEEKA